MARLALISGMGGCFFHVTLCRIANLAKTDGKSCTPSPKKVKYGNWCALAYAASSFISGGSEGGLLFHFILFKIVGV